MARWASLAAAWLLAGVGGAAAEKTTSEPYDCKAGYSTWQVDWSGSKKEWCCRVYNLGCKPSSQHLTIEGYDCDLAIGNFVDAWSPEKKEWCCEREGKGCAADASLRLCRGIWEDFGWWDFGDDMEVRPTEEQEHKECCVVAGRGGCCSTRKLGDLCFDEASEAFDTPGSETYSGFQLQLRGSGLHRWEGLFAGGRRKTSEGYWENITAALIGDVGLAPGERALILGEAQQHADSYQACHVDMLTKKHECCNAETQGTGACCDTEDGHKLCFHEGVRIVNVTEGDDSFNYAITVEDKGCGNYTGRFTGGKYEVQVSVLASTFAKCSRMQPEEDASEQEEEDKEEEEEGQAEAADPHHCLRWQGHGGCDSIVDEQLCLRSRDGRPRREWRDRTVAGQPCAWCAGELCTSSSDAKCMPADWVRGRPNVTVANCSEGQKSNNVKSESVLAGTPKHEFEKSYQSSRCGLESRSEQDPEKPYFTYTAESVDQCKAFCSSHVYCAGIGFSMTGESGVCQVWWHAIESVVGASGHECVKVRGIPGADSMTGIPKLWEYIEHEEGGPCSAPTCSSIPARPTVVPNGCPWGYVGSDFCISTMTRTTTTTTKTATSTSTSTTTKTITKTMTKTITKTTTNTTTTTRATTTTRSTKTKPTESSTTATTTRKTEQTTTQTQPETTTGSTTTATTAAPSTKTQPSTITKTQPVTATRSTTTATTAAPSTKTQPSTITKTQPSTTTMTTTATTTTFSTKTQTSTTARTTRTTTTTTTTATTATTTTTTKTTTTLQPASSTATTGTTTASEAAFLGGAGLVLGGDGPAEDSPDDPDSGELRELQDNDPVTIPGANAIVLPEEGGDPISVEHLTIDTGGESPAFEEAPAQQEEPRSHDLTKGEQAAIGVSVGVASAALLGGLLGGLLTTTPPITVLTDGLGGSSGSKTEPQPTTPQPTTLTTTWISSSGPERAVRLGTAAAESGMPGWGWLAAAAVVAAVVAGLCCFAYERSGGSKHRGVLLQGDEENAAGSSSDETATPRSKETPLFWPVWTQCSEGAGTRRLLEDADPASPLNRSSPPSSPVRFVSRVSVASPGGPSPGRTLTVPSSPVLGAATPQAPAPLWLGAHRPPVGACSPGASFQPLKPTTASGVSMPLEPVATNSYMGGISMPIEPVATNAYMAGVSMPIEPVATNAHMGASFVPH